MREYDLKVTDENIKRSIIDDSLNRNSKLNKLMELLNSISGNRIIAIDGKWGSGKTIFLRQLEYLNKKTIDVMCKLKISAEINDKFKDNYLIYYYNAWENDYHSNPLLSLIYNLINEFPQNEKKIASNKIEVPFSLKNALKTISCDFYDTSKVESFKDITSQIYTVEKKKEALNNIVKNILPDDKRLIFIIDELDRCKPDYAINMLEIIKHFYSNERLIFLIGINNEQLSHTISNYYGNNFDGYGYLNKFYDLIIELDEISPSMYLRYVIKKDDSKGWVNAVLFAICRFFDFQMRDINRLLSDYDLLGEYFDSNGVEFYDDIVVLKYIFLPYCLGLKLKSKKQLTEFLKGNGYINLEKFIKSNDKMIRIVKYGFEKNNEFDSYANVDEEKILDYLRDKYNEYFVYEQENLETRHSKTVFLDIFSLLSNYSKI